MKNIFLAAISCISFYAQSQYINLEGDTVFNAPYIKYFHDNYVLAGSGVNATTSLLDCSDPTNIINVSSVSILGSSDYIQVENSIVYSGSWMTNRVSIADFSVLFAPLTLGTLTNLNGLPSGIAVNGDYFYLSLGNDSLYVVDQSDLNTPAIINKVNIGAGYSYEILIDDTLVYAATANGLKVVNVSDPVNPTLISTIGGSYFEISIDTLGDRIFVSKGNSSGFDVFDITDPTNISIINSGGNGYTGRGVAYYDNKIYQATQNGTTNIAAVYDLSTFPATMIASHPIASGSSGVTAKDSTFYVGDYVNFSIFSLSALPLEIPNNYLSISAYPNPFLNSITISCPLLDSAQVGLLEIQNSQGNIVFSTTLTESSETISLDGLLSGVYFWKLQVNDTYGSGKFVKP
jgi:hypothetical protein